jgi:hypothetical protein
MARTICGSVSCCQSSPVDEMVARRSLSSIAQQIISLRVDLAPAKAHVLLLACTRMLSSLPVFQVFMELQSCVIMVNRLFQELALYVAPTGSKSRLPCHSLVIHQMLRLLSALVKYSSATPTTATPTAATTTRATPSATTRATTSAPMDSSATPTTNNAVCPWTTEQVSLITTTERTHRSELFGAKRGDILSSVLRHSIGTATSATATSTATSTAGSSSELIAQASLRLFAQVVCGESATTTSPEHLQYLMPMLTDHILFLKLFALNNDPIALLVSLLCVLRVLRVLREFTFFFPVVCFFFLVSSFLFLISSFFFPSSPFLLSLLLPPFSFPYSFPLPPFLFPSPSKSRPIYCAKSLPTHP